MRFNAPQRADRLTRFTAVANPTDTHGHLAPTARCPSERIRGRFRRSDHEGERGLSPYDASTQTPGQDRQYTSQVRHCTACNPAPVGAAPLRAPEASHTPEHLTHRAPTQWTG
ncbi:unnamed protein product [Lota lota]